MKKPSILSIGLLAAISGSLALLGVATRADDTPVVRKSAESSVSLNAYLERREGVRGKLDASVNREIDNLKYDRFVPKWSFVTVFVDDKGMTTEREQAILCPHGFVYRNNPHSNSISVALPTRYLVTVANLPFVQRMSADTQRNAR
jgi:hypothetical protein